MRICVKVSERCDVSTQVLLSDKMHMYTVVKFQSQTMRDEKVSAEKALQVHETASSKEVARLRRRAKAAERDITLARKALRTKETVDKKGEQLCGLVGDDVLMEWVLVLCSAVVVAGEMQREVTAKRGQLDSLQTKINWLEECLDAALRVRPSLPLMKPAQSAASRSRCRTRSSCATRSKCWRHRSTVARRK